MKSIFSSSFLPQRQFFMGQAAQSIAPESIQYAMDIFNQAQAWLKSHPDAASWLGPVTYPTFKQAYDEAASLYGDMPDFAETLTTGGSLADSEIAEAKKFMDDAGVAWGAIRQTPVSQAPAAAAPVQTTTPSTPTQITQAAATAAKTIVQAKTGVPPTPVKPVAAPAAPASDLTTPLAVGGGLIALAVIVAIAR